MRKKILFTMFISVAAFILAWNIKNQGLHLSSDQIKRIQQHAQQGSSSDQFTLALMYKTGKGANKSHDDFMYWLNKSAKQSNENAQIRLAAEHLQGSHHDNTEGINWLRKAAKGGSVKAQHLLALSYYYGRSVPKDYKQAFDYFREAAKQNELDSMFFIGLCYENGKGVSKDRVEAYNWFLRAAEKGHIEAQKILASKYSIGETLPKNLTLAFQWYKKAADSGDAMSQDIIGRMYSTGDGVEKNPSLSHDYFKKASEQGYIEAEADLARFHYQEKEFEKAYSFAKKAACHGSIYAQELLGILYINGEGVQQDNIRGYFWLSYALKNDTASSKIKEDIQNLEEELSQEELNEAKNLLKEHILSECGSGK